MVPVFALGEGPGDHVDHVFRWVGVFGTGCVVAGEVFFEGYGVFANVSEVDGLSSLGEEEEAIELEEELGAGLMDGDKDGLTDVCKLAQEPDDVECSLSIETGSGFVQEDENAGFGYEFDSNGQSFPLFNREACARCSNESVLNIVHFKQVDNCIHIFEFLLPRCGSRLAEESRELESFSDSCKWFVNIELFTVTG